MKQSDLVFFVHIPKAAGSTINHYLENGFGKGYSQVANFINKRDLFKERAVEADWLSGHVTYPVIRDLLSEITNRKIRYFACMREPKAQVISHFNWLIEIGRRTPEFFFGHPPRIQEMSLEIRSADLSKRCAIMHLLLKHRGLFLNCQARVILGGQSSNDDAFIQKTISQFEFIGTSDNIGPLLSRIGVSVGEILTKKNTSHYHFDVDLFEDEEVKRFLCVHNHIDNRLYVITRRHFDACSQADGCTV